MHGWNAMPHDRCRREPASDEPTPLIQTSTTGSRFVVSCSATLEVRRLGEENLTETGSGAVRTGFCFDGSVKMRALPLESGGPGSGHHMLVEWNPRSWKKHKLVEED
jgi:hypothetical protein